jgi:hydroxymethylbilane synthase
VPIIPPDGVEIAAVASRLTPFSAFVTYDAIILDEFEQGAVIGVEGQAQAAQLINYRPELTVVIVDGAIRSRLRRLEDEDVDALVIPAAFTEWLDLQDRVSEVFSVDVIVPTAGQGSLSLLRRAGDARIDPLAARVEDIMARREVDVERLTVRRLHEGGAHLAAALARQQGREITIDAMIVDAGGRKRFHHVIEGDRDDADTLSGELAEVILGMRRDAEV